MHSLAAHPFEDLVGHLHLSQPHEALQQRGEALWQRGREGTVRCRRVEGSIGWQPSRMQRCGGVAGLRGKGGSGVLCWGAWRWGSRGCSSQPSVLIHRRTVE